MELYINYWSRVRAVVGMAEAAFDAEIAYNKNRIATKVVSTINLATTISKQIFDGENNINTRCNLYNTVHRDKVILEPVLDGGHKINKIYTDYSEFNIPKHSGGFRTICAPGDDLKYTQRYIANIITNKMKFLPHNAAHGFTKHRNCKTALEVHAAKGSRWFLKIDIEDFFPNSTVEKLEKMMKQVYPFCTWGNCTKENVLMICTRNGALPQGAPTSPVLTNAIMVPCDVKITAYCKEKGLVYTRYADDILISGRENFNWQEVQSAIQAILDPYGYKIKESKTRYGNFNGRNWNLGLMYNNKGDITVGHARKKLVKNLIHNYTTKPEQQTKENWYYLNGILSYCSYIEPEYFKKYVDIMRNQTMPAQ